MGLTDILRTSLFQHFAFEETEATTFGLTRPGSSFPLLSQGDHPTLGTPCWHLHPCETLRSVEEVMAEVDSTGLTEKLRLIRWLEMWFMVVGTAVNLRP
jgi:ubiquitin-like-conjugating enzyme ATG10